MPDPAVPITPEALAALQATLEASKATIDDLATRLDAAEAKLADPNLLAAWGRVTDALAALQASLAAQPAPPAA